MKDVKSMTEQELQQMALEYELYKNGAKFSEDIYFKIDIVNTTVMFLGNHLKRFKNNEVVHDYIRLVDEVQMIHPDDRERFADAVSDLPRGIVRPIKFRLNYQDGTIVWYHAQYDIIKDESGMPISAIGVINNIQENQELESRATLDLLTSCLNKGSFENIAKKLINESAEGVSGQHAFIIIDVDNFKAVNDNLGHFFGDIVLKEIAGKLKRIFRETDYVGRIGGDEFAVIMKNVDEKIIEGKIETLLNAMAVTYRGMNGNYAVSGSIGVALFPKHGMEYEDVYQNADAALYHSKFTGKNKFTIYNKNISTGTMLNTTPFDVASRTLSQHFDRGLTSDTFNLLFESDDYESSLATVLSHIGAHYNIDRVYIFERLVNSTELYANTYEWCREGIEPQKHLLQEITFDNFAELFNNANEENVYYCNDISAVKDETTHHLLEMQDIKSFLHAYVKKENGVKYVFGFDDCTSERVWSPKEISTLIYISKIISQFLAYKQALTIVHNQSRDNLRVLSSLNFYGYIVNAMDWTLKYVNDMTRDLVPDAEIGKRCYEVLRGNTKPCPDCPIRELMKKPDSSKVKMLIHNDKLSLDVLVTASRVVRYDGEEHVFVSSTDIREIVDFIPKELRDFSKFVVVE